MSPLAAVLAQTRHFLQTHSIGIASEIIFLIFGAFWYIIKRFFAFLRQNCFLVLAFERDNL